MSPGSAAQGKLDVEYTTASRDEPGAGMGIAQDGVFVEHKKPVFGLEATMTGNAGPERWGRSAKFGAQEPISRAQQHYLLRGLYQTFLFCNIGLYN